jgi:hypothetical protein
VLTKKLIREINARKASEEIDVRAHLEAQGVMIQDMGERQEIRLARLEAGLIDFMKERVLPNIPYKMKAEKSTQTEARPRTTAD